MSMGDSDIIVDVLQKLLIDKWTAKDRMPCGAEVGVHRGELSAKLLSELPIELFMVDPWATYEPETLYRQSGDKCARLTADEQHANMLAAIEATDFAEKRRGLVRTTSIEAAQRLLESQYTTPFDFVFIDADHTYKAVCEDLRAWWPLLKPGGIFAGHDYGHPRDKRGQWGVKDAVDEFTAEHNLSLSVAGTCWWTVKPDDFRA